MEYKERSTLPKISAWHDGGLTIEELKRASLQFRRDIIELTRCSGTSSSHVGGELSSVEVLAVLFGNILRLDPENPDWELRDRFILAKGHCSGALYVAMAWRGFFPREMLWNEFNRVGGRLQEHANMTLAGIEAPTGSLGMGLSNACGMAWASRLRFGYPPPYQLYCLLGDGECNSGQVWEAAMAASQLKLGNLTACVDYNKYTVSGRIDQTMGLEPFAAKWESFGWEVIAELKDGHDENAILGAFERAKASPEREKPKMIILHTKKGRGISFMEENPFKWHAGHLDDALYTQCMKELGV